MRVIAGRLGGRNFNSPRGHRTHPMSDKVRGALFNTLGDVSSLTILDAFAGSGALSFEAISRGAISAVALESDRSAQQAITDNIQTLEVTGQVKLIKASASAWLSTTEEAFDVVLCDPPYNDLQIALLQRLAERTAKDGVVVFSLPPDAELTLNPHFQLLSRKSYGDAELVFYRRIA